MIKVENLSKSFKVFQRSPGLLSSIKALFKREYANVEAVKNISFELNEGEIVGFLGPNGAGKTTSLKMLSGLIYPSSGRVSICGYDPKKRENGFLKSITLIMGQRQQLTWDLTPADSFLLNKTLFEVADQAYKERVGLLVEMLGIQNVVNKPVRRLSLGERMKCELVTALIHNPKVLFLDEPTLGLDIGTQVALRSFIRDYNKQHRATILLTSHYMADVTSLAERIIVINKGCLTYQGSLDELVRKYSPAKLLKISFSEPVPVELLEQFGQLRKREAYKAEILVEQAKVNPLTAAILARESVVDLKIEDLAIEEIINRVFVEEVHEKVSI